MAYGNFLASVEESRLASFRLAPFQPLRASLVVDVSHLVAYWVKAQPLGSLLSEALDGGEKLSDTLRHPFREPIFHSAQAVLQLESALRTAWKEAKSIPNFSPQMMGYLEGDIVQVLSLFGHAAARHEAVVSFLEPSSEEQANKIELFLDDP